MSATCTRTLRYRVSSPRLVPRILSLWAIALLGAAIPLRAFDRASYCPPPQAASAIDEAVKERIRVVEPALAPEDRDLVEQFYSPCGYALAWVASGEISPVAVSARELIRSAGNRGLNPADYPSPPEPSAPTGDPRSTRQFTRWEIELTIATMRLAGDLRCGRVDPRRVEADLPDTCSDFQPAAFLWAAVQDNSLVSSFDSLEPNAPGYRRTKQAYQRFTELAHEAQPDFPPWTTPLKPGDTWGGMPALRERLERTADLEVTQSSDDPNRYDEDLVHGVQAFQVRHGLTASGTLTRETYRQLTTPITVRVKQLGLTLERWRWIERQFTTPLVVVNIPEFRLRAYDSDLNVVLAMKVIVGSAYRRRTPVFQNQISAVVFRPFWNVPASIERTEIAPAARRDPEYLMKHDFEMVHKPSGGFRVRQRPGDTNALGLIKFLLPNIYDVYLHGTPEPRLFGNTRRDFSHGCIRLEDPAALAVWLLKDTPGWTLEQVEASMHDDATFTLSLKTPVTILIVYGTAFAAEDGRVYFLPDIYGEDKSLMQNLEEVSATRADEDRLDASALE